jgi:hypothetical protein
MSKLAEDLLKNKAIIHYHMNRFRVADSEREDCVQYVLLCAAANKNYQPTNVSYMQGFVSNKVSTYKSRIEWNEYDEWQEGLESYNIDEPLNVNYFLKDLSVEEKRCFVAVMENLSVRVAAKKLNKKQCTTKKLFEMAQKKLRTSPRVIEHFSTKLIQKITGE